MQIINKPCLKSVTKKEWFSQYPDNQITICNWIDLQAASHRIMQQVLNSFLWTYSETACWLCRMLQLKRGQQRGTSPSSWCWGHLLFKIDNTNKVPQLFAPILLQVRPLFFVSTWQSHLLFGLQCPQNHYLQIPPYCIQNSFKLPKCK